MPHWKYFLKRRSSTVSLAPVNEGKCDDPTEFYLPTNPKDVKLQQSEPQTLPSAEADVHTVRFFLYHVLTFRGNHVAKRWPQWVLETVAYWKGDGKALRELQGDLSRLCPMSAGYAQLDSKASFESSPSGDCRTRIGLVLTHTINKLKNKEEVKVKTHEEWLALQRGSGHPWSQSVVNLHDTASNYSAFPSQSGAASIHSQAHLSNTMPDLRALYSAHTAYTPTQSHYAPSLALTGYGIPRASSTVPLDRESTSGRVYDSSVESPGASGDRSSGTCSTDATSLKGSSSSVLGGKGKQASISMTAPTNAIPSPGQEYFSRIPSVTSNMAPSHRSLQSSTSSKQQPTRHEETLIMAEASDALPTQSLAHSARERSHSGTSYATSRRFNIDNLSARYRDYHADDRYSSSPARYRGGTPRTLGTLPQQPSMNFPHSGIFAPHDRAASVVSSIAAPIGPHVVNATPPGRICGQMPTPQLGPIPPRTPSCFSINPSLRSLTPTISQMPIQDPQVRTMHSFTGTLRSANTAKVDNFALAQGEYAVFKAKDTPERSVVARREMERRGIIGKRGLVQSMQRMVPGNLQGEEAASTGPEMRIINPDTGLPYKTLYENIQERNVLDGRM